MTTPHRATPEQWNVIANWAAKDSSPNDSCLLELRNRVEVLEQLHQAVVDLNERFSLEPLVARVEALEAAQQRKVAGHLDLKPFVEALEAAQQPEPVDEAENDRRFEAAMAAIDFPDATPAPADHSRDATEMVGPVATDQELLNAWVTEEGLYDSLRTVYDLGCQYEARRTEAQIAELRGELAAASETIRLDTIREVATFLGGHEGLEDAAHTLLHAFAQHAFGGILPSAARGARSASMVAPLDWTENLPPCEECRYDHCKASTPFVDFLITWKGWKENHQPTVDETPWGSWGEACISVQQAKQWCQAEYKKRLQACFLATTEPTVAPARIIADRYQLGDSIRRAWLTHGQDSWCVIADCVIAELEDEPTARTATEPAPPQSGGRVRDGVSWSEREDNEQFIPFTVPLGTGIVSYLIGTAKTLKDCGQGHTPAQQAPPNGELRQDANRTVTSEHKIRLVKRVAQRLASEYSMAGARPGADCTPFARAAIRMVAAWMRTHQDPSAHAWAMRLEQEAIR
jgi:hypothetical protein